MNSQESKIDDLLRVYEEEQRQFENHNLWRELQTTPQSFFTHVKEIIKESGIPQAVWQNKVQEAKQALQTRMKEKNNQFEKFNFNHLNGIKA